jgi:hypothetical protein
MLRLRTLDRARRAQKRGTKTVIGCTIMQPIETTDQEQL